jgi:hypothetical protein
MTLIYWIVGYFLVSTAIVIFAYYDAKKDPIFTDSASQLAPIMYLWPIFLIFYIYNSAKNSTKWGKK